jgi:hypothetical protein
MPYIKSGTPQKDFNWPGVIDVYNSGNVFINGTQVALYNAPNNAESFVLALIASPTFAREQSVFEIDGEEDEAIVEAKQRELVKAGVITQYELDKGKQAGANALSSFAGASTSTAVGLATTTTVAASVVDDTLLYDSPNTKIKWYVKTVTKQPGVIFPYDVATLAEPNGTTVDAVVKNLSLLVTNCLDPIKNKFPDAFITCSFRKKGVGATTSQHPFGLAADIQYSSASKADYFTRAKWIADNLDYDQFILEYKTTGTGKPWHHISFAGASNRKLVYTFMNDKNCKGPGVQGLFDLSNT